MKKIISAVLIFVLIMGLSSTSFAAQTDDLKLRARAPEVLLNSETDYYVNGEDIIFTVRIFDHDIFNLEQVKIYIDCNKNVLKYKGERIVASSQRTEFAIDETETGYVITFTHNTQMNTCVFVLGAGFTFSVDDVALPDVKTRAEIKYADKDAREAVFGASLPINEIFEREEIPVLSLTGDLAVFAENGVLYLDDAKSLSELKQKITSTIPEYKVVYDSFGDEERDYSVTGDKYYIEFGGYRSDEIEVCVVGDVDRNGKITAADARLALTYSAKTAVFPENFPKSADIDRDGRMTASDVRKILRVASKIDEFENPEKTVFEGKEFVIEKLLNAGSGAYNWKCTVSDESAFEITDTIAPPENVEINPGTPFEQTFAFKALKTGTYNVHFELIRSWEDEPIEEFGFTIVVDGVLGA